MKLILLIIVTGIIIIFSSCEKDEMDSLDNKGCEEYSFASDIMPIISNICTQCHNGTVQTPDFRTYQEVKNNAAKVKQLTASRIMPKEGSLTDEQIKMIGCWVDAGAPNN